MILSYYHKQAARALIMGRGEREVARALGVQIVDIRRWKLDVDFMKFMQKLEDTLDEDVYDFMNQLKREAYEQIHHFLQSKDPEQRMWAIDRVFRNADAMHDANKADPTYGQPIQVNNFIESPEAKQLSKRYLELTRGGKRQEAIPVRATVIEEN